MLFGLLKKQICILTHKRTNHFHCACVVIKAGQSALTFREGKLSKKSLNTVNPLFSPPPPRGGLFISSPREGGLNRDGGLFERRGLFNLKTTMVSVLHKELEYKVEKLEYKTF